ncbi:MAG: tyrosine-protein phosphatase, partial [Bacteroidales bacterium]|nr:tyrosine-protein phosphatase [Bacteroidales bacterium]
RDDKEKTRQCIAFIFNCVANNEPVYFHCSLGRDRTGTVSLLILGILGVNEGDISKEYEITQFAPSGYSVSEGEKTQMTRLSGVDYDGAAKFLWEYGKHGDGSYDEFQECVRKYLNEIGIDDAAIQAFRSAMLEDAPAE